MSHLLLPDFVLNFTAELGASLAMAALGQVRQALRTDPETAALQHAYATGVAAMLKTFPVRSDLEYEHYQSLLQAYFERKAVQVELIKLVQPNHSPLVNVLEAELQEAIYLNTIPGFDLETAVHALLQGFEIGAYDSEEFRSRLTLKQLSQIGQHTTQQTKLLEAMTGDLRHLSQQMMAVTFVPAARSQHRVGSVSRGEQATTVSPTHRPHINYLVEQIREGRVALFVGAGVSREAGLPGGWELAEMLATEIDYAPQPGDTLGAIAEYYMRELSWSALIDRLVMWLDTNAEPGPSHQLIPYFDWRAIYTTNYDQLLEHGYEALDKPFHKVLYNPQLRDLSTGVTPIIKLHGCLSRAHRRSRESPLVITDLNYESYGQNREALTSKLKQFLFDGNTLLFLGYGLRDRFWQDLRQDVVSTLKDHTRSYYTVMPHFTPQWAAYWRDRQVHLIADTAHTFLQQLDPLGVAR